MRSRLLLAVTIIVLLAATPCLAGEGNLAELARIQTGLNRAAAGLPPETMSSDPLEQIVAAFSKGWASSGADPTKAGPILDEVEAEVDQRSKNLALKYPGRFSPLFGFADYLNKLSSVIKSDPTPLTRLVVALHGIDAILIAENVHPSGFNYATGDFVEWPSRDGLALRAWLRLPCRTLLGRNAEFQTAIAALGDVAGPILDCPGPAKTADNLSALVAFAHHPAATARSIARHTQPMPIEPPTPLSPRVPPRGAWSHETAVMFMARDPRRAEFKLQQAATPGQKLDYALFLFTFHRPSPQRDMQIERLLAAISASAQQAPGSRRSTAPPFDGSTASMTSAVADQDIYVPASDGKTGSPYAIPCAVLIRVPALVKALESQYGGGRDQWLPKSGCATGRGFVPGFPEAEVRAFETAAAAPTHDWLTNFEGSLVNTLIQQGLEQYEIVRLDPKAILANHALHAGSMPPYRVWSYLSLDNKRIQAGTQRAFWRAERPLATYYRQKGLSASAAKWAADAGLRSLAYGEDCGGAGRLRPSFRTLLLDGASLDRIKIFAASRAWRDATAVAAFNTCATYAGEDPLIHVAVARPDVLSFLWTFVAHQPAAATQVDLMLDVEARNAFSKTPLMTAAQFNQARSVRLLLLHHANPNARTDATGTAWAGRTPLMYAAATASLSTIRMLLHAGADPQIADSKGAKALHYLLGYGPLPNNPRLSSKDLAEAARLLY